MNENKKVPLKIWFGEGNYNHFFAGGEFDRHRGVGMKKKNRGVVTLKETVGYIEFLKFTFAVIIIWKILHEVGYHENLITWKNADEKQV